MRVVEYFEGKNIFLTGGSGFLGKVLIEKLLRSCPKIGTIYILLREKKGRSLESRMEVIKNLAILIVYNWWCGFCERGLCEPWDLQPYTWHTLVQFMKTVGFANALFNRLREENPDALKKMVAVKGDVCDINLGLSAADRNMLIEKVNIVYHTAASVRFDDLLREAIIINVRGTRELVKLALELKNISFFVHVSTTYCNTDKNVIEEKLYPAHTNWKDAITIAEECEDAVLNSMAVKYMSPLPNTYTFAKSLAEHVVNDMCNGKIPALILRPSVVISTLEDPIPGWNDNFNGPIGLLVAGGKGLLRTVLGNRNSRPDYVPVDYVIKGIIVATKHYALNGNNNEIEVLNASQHQINNLKMGEVIDMGKELVQDTPFPTILWYPRFSMTQCWYNYYIQVLLFHMLPAFFLDIGLRIAGKKPMLFAIQRKIYIANNVLEYFMRYSWVFKNGKLVNLVKTLSEDELQTFGVSLEGLSQKQLFEYFKNGKIGAAKFILKEEFNTEGAKANLRRLWYLDMTAKFIFFSFIFWILSTKLNILRITMNSIEHYIRDLP